MIDVKNKAATVESLSVLHEHNKDTYMSMVNPTGSGLMTFDGSINAESLNVSGEATIDKSVIVGGSVDIMGSLYGDENGELKVNSNMSVNGNIVINDVNNGLYCLHPETQEPSCMVHMNPYGNTVIGYDGYINANGNSFICGNDVEHHIGSAGIHYRPYYREGDTIDIHVRTAGYVTNMNKSVVFTIPLTKPIIGRPYIDIISEKGFILRQDAGYTHGSDGSTIPATYVHPINYSVDNNFNSGLIVTANFENGINSRNNDTIGIYLDCQIKLYGATIS